MIIVFDNQRINMARARAHTSPSDSFFLFDWTKRHIEERLSLVRRTFPQAIQIGTRGGPLQTSMFGIEQLWTLDRIPESKPDILGMPDFLPLAPHSVDLIVSSLDVHTINDLPGMLIQCRQALKPDGLFLAAMMGGETLFELRQSLIQADMDVYGGAFPRVAPFADKPQIGALLQRAGFTLPVVDSEILTVTYPSIFKLMHDLRAMGETNSILERKKNFTSRSVFIRTHEYYTKDYTDPDGRLRASFEIIFMIGWAAHSSQQKPLRPGSAQNRLADALQTIEMKTGERP